LAFLAELSTPPHVGHLILAEECRTQLRLDRLLWVVTNQPPHKLDQTLSPVEKRVEMVQLSIAGNSHFELSRVDIDRPGPHYAVDTVRLLQEQLPEAELFYLMGEIRCTICRRGMSHKNSWSGARG